MKKSFVFLVVTICFLAQSCYYDNKEELYQYVDQEECTVTTATFTADIVQIMTTHCIRCHRNGREDGNVNLEGYNNVKSYATAGSLYGTSNHDPGYNVMPTSGVKIPFCDLEKMRLWIEAGALNN